MQSCMVRAVINAVVWSGWLLMQSCMVRVVINKVLHGYGWY